MPPDSTLHTHFFFPHSFILLQLHMALLASSATFPIFLNRLFLSFPVNPISLSNIVSDLAGNPLHPTSTAHTLTLHPFLVPSSAIGAYFAFFTLPRLLFDSRLGLLTQLCPIVLYFQKLAPCQVEDQLWWWRLGFLVFHLNQLWLPSPGQCQNSFCYSCFGSSLASSPLLLQKWLILLSVVQL